jgi:hypothetical protein
MRVNHCGGDILVAEQLLDGAYVGARLEEMRGEAMSQTGSHACKNDLNHGGHGAHGGKTL